MVDTEQEKMDERARCDGMLQKTAEKKSKQG
jgi:hypothetical protein